MANKNRVKRPAGSAPVMSSQPPAHPGLMQKLRNREAAAERFFKPCILPLEILAVVFLVAAGAFFRMEDITQWKKAESQTFFDGQPLHTTFDAYFYLSLAKDLVDGTYHATDEKRGVPDSPPRPSPAPLISVLAAKISTITNKSLSWVGAVMPALLGGLLALPLYLLMRYYSGGLAGFTAALLALLYPFYIYRSGFGRFDTDCLIVTFILNSAYLFLRFAMVVDWKRYMYFTLALVNYGLFLWWWDQAPAVVTAITFLPFAVALIFYYRPSKKEGWIFAGFIAAGLLLAIAIKGPGLFWQMFKAIVYQFLYITKDASGEFPNIGITISEQSIPPISTIIDFTTGTIPGFIFAFAGIGLLVYRTGKSSLFLCSIFMLSALAFTYANRFILFLVPLLGIGSGYLLGELWKLRKKFLLLYIICPVLLLYLAWPLYAKNAKNAQYPKLNAFTVAGMAAAQHKTPQDAVVWAWWDNGYALTYFARRATINDGSIHSGDRTYYNALPLALTDFRLAANFMHFYAVRGIAGIEKYCKNCYRSGMSKREAMELLKRVLAAGPDSARILLNDAIKAGRPALFPLGPVTEANGWLPFFFPHNKRPIYLFLDTLLARVAYWWYWFGTWNPETRNGIHPNYQVMGGLRMQNSLITGPSGLQLNINTGEMMVEGHSVQLARLTIRTENDVTEKKYTTDSKYFFDYNGPGRYGALTDRNMTETVFEKLFVLNSFDRRYFKPVDLRGMTCQLWEVTADNYKAAEPLQNADQ